MSDIVYTMAVGFAPLLFMYFSVSVSEAARNLGRIADEMKASREEQRRQFDLERQYPRAP